ncbi:MAG TPA: glycosyltransferase family 4 protein [Gemmatimonadales bacterium]|nr:glycosyltransferase family 4 protein [Gemmatimonadales bacterium]
MKLLVVNWRDRTNPQAGGAEVHLHEIFGRVAARGHEVHLLASRYPGAAADATLDGMAVHRVAGEYGFAARGRRAFAALARALRPDVVVEDVNKVPLYLPLRWRGPLVLLVPHLFGTTAFREVAWPVALAVWAAERPMPAVYRRAAVHAISDSTRDDLVRRGFAREAIRVIYPGVDAAHYAPAAGVARAGRPRFLYVGRLKRYKAVETAIAALALLRRSAAPDAELVIAGSGDDRARLERLAAGGSGVTFLGRVSEEAKLALYREAWAVVFPSPKEGWGITNLEAAGCGTPAVASDSPGLRESVRHGETGLLVPHGDAGAMAAALGELVRDAALRERLGRGARAFAESLSWDRAARETEAHLEAAAAAGPRGQERG